MEFLLVIHLMICAAMIAVVLLQKSEGGALGMGGGGGGGGGFLTGRGTANLLTRTTAMLAAGFFLTSIALSLLSTRPTAPKTPFNTPTTSQPATDGKPGTAGTKPAGGLLDSLKKGQGSQRLPSVPQGN